MSTEGNGSAARGLEEANAARAGRLRAHCERAYMALVGLQGIGPRTALRAATWLAQDDHLAPSNLERLRAKAAAFDEVDKMLNTPMSDEASLKRIHGIVTGVRA